jgi:uncharacterized protein (TIGR00288 family)
MTSNPLQRDGRVAVLVDCDNVAPDILEHALRMAAQFGRVVMRRGYGNHATLAHKWQEALTRLAFTPQLQYQYAPGKNTADIALALDTLEAHFDGRADTFCLVTSDSDFVYLCRKLRERGATVCVVGEPKTPDALRHASDYFYAFPEKAEAPRPEAQKPVDKRRPRFIVDAVTLLAGEAPDGQVHLGPLGDYLRRKDPAFLPKTYGHSGLLNMVKTYDMLETNQEAAGGWTVGLAGARHAQENKDQGHSGAPG